MNIYFSVGFGWVTCMYSQTNIYSHTFNISHIISQFIRYSLENGNKIWQELRVKLCQNTFSNTLF